MRKKGGGGGREAPRCSTCRDESATLRLLLLLGALATVQMRPGPGALATVLVPLQQEQWSVGPCWVPWAVAAPRPRSACAARPPVRGRRSQAAAPLGSRHCGKRRRAGSAPAPTLHSERQSLPGPAERVRKHVTPTVLLLSDAHMSCMASTRSSQLL